MILDHNEKNSKTTQKKEFHLLNRTQVFSRKEILLKKGAKT